MTFYEHSNEKIDLFWNMIRYFFWKPAHVTQSDPVCKGVMPPKKAALWTSKAHPDLHVFVAISHPSLAIAGSAGTLVAALLMVTGCGCRQGLSQQWQLILLSSPQLARCFFQLYFLCRHSVLSPPVPCSYQVCVRFVNIHGLRAMSAATAGESATLSMPPAVLHAVWLGRRRVCVWHHPPQVHRRRTVRRRALEQALHPRCCCCLCTRTESPRVCLCVRAFCWQVWNTQGRLKRAIFEYVVYQGWSLTP